MKPEALRGYQPNRVNSLKVYAVVALMFVAVLLCLAGVGMWLFVHQQHAAKAQPPLSMLERERVLPPAPRLQAQPREDGERALAAQRIHLDSFGWVDHQRHIVHLPLEQARQLLLKRGWPNAVEDAHAR